MAKTTAKNFRIVWNASRKSKSGAEELYVMRSDFAVLHKTITASGKSDGWKLDHRHELDMGAFRKRLIGLGFVIGKGGDLPAKVAEEVSRIPTLSEIISSQSDSLADDNQTQKGTEKMTQHNLKILSNKELVVLYNQASGKTIKRFSTRAVGERLTAAALAVPSPITPAGSAKKKAHYVPKSSAKAQKANGSGSKGKIGRPAIQFSVKLTADEAKSNLQKQSSRQKVVDWLKEQKGGTATIAQLEEKFGKVRGVVTKLAFVGWVKVIETEAAPAAVDAA